MSCRVYFRQLRRSMWETDDDAQYIDRAAMSALGRMYGGPWTTWKELPRMDFDRAVRNYLHLPRSRSAYTAHLLSTLNDEMRKALTA